MKEGLTISEGLTQKKTIFEEAAEAASKLESTDFDVEAYIASTGIDMKKLGENVLADAKELGEELRRSLECIK